METISLPAWSESETSMWTMKSLKRWLSTLSSWWKVMKISWSSSLSTFLFWDLSTGTQRWWRPMFHMSRRGEITGHNRSTDNIRRWSETKTDKRTSDRVGRRNSDNCRYGQPYKPRWPQTDSRWEKKIIIRERRGRRRWSSPSPPQKTEGMIEKKKE